MGLSRYLLALLPAVPLLGACGVTTRDGKEHSAGGSGSTGQVPTGATCTGPEVLIPKRLVRLTFNQQLNAVASLFGQPLADAIRDELQIPAAHQHAFPPLSDPREGSAIFGDRLQTSDEIAQTVGEYVHENFAAVTTCGEAPGDECAEGYLGDLAQRAFRRPLSEAERARLLAVYQGVVDDGGTVQEGVQYGVYAVFASPLFLYRTEFGADSAVEGPLLGHEQASLISFFLTDAPPDPALLDAGASGQLSTDEGIAAEVQRLLATDAAKRNLQAALFTHFGLGRVEHVVIDSAVAPEFGAALARSMAREGELFIDSVLWNGPLGELLTSRRTTIDERLAALYGVAFPPPGVSLDADGFASVELPENRAGLLTQLGFLTARSRPDGTSVVHRGLAVNQAFVCAPSPPFPEGIVEQLELVNPTGPDMSEREKAEARAATEPCAGCHVLTDPYGVALESYDVIGRFRTADDEGRPIDASVTLPPAAGGAAVANAVEMAAALAQSEAFPLCVAKNLITFALAEGGGDTESCATRAVAERFARSDRTFGELVEIIASSKVVQLRAAGGAAP